MSALFPWVLLILGLGIGIGIGWLMACQKALKEKHQLEQEYQAKLSLEALANSQQETELRLLQQQFMEIQSAHQQLQESFYTSQSERTRFETLLNDARQQEDRLAVMGQTLLKQVKEEIQGDLEKEYSQKEELAQAKIGELIKPLSEMIEAHQKKVEEVEEYVNDVEKQRIDETSQLKTLIDVLDKDARRLAEGGNRLADALSNSKGRGDWGEMQLARLLESSGLLPGVHYDLQYSMQDENSKLLRPDVAVKFTNNRLLYIDAKTILTNLERLEHAFEEADAKSERKKHVAALEKEILSLSTKAYDAKKSDSIDFIVLFVPRESMLRVALEEKPDLMEQAFNKRIILASPLILMAILRTIAIGWQEAQLSQNAKEIYTLARELHKRTVTFSDHFLKIEMRLKQVMDQFDDAKTSLCGRMGVINQLTKLEKLGCKSEKQLSAQMLAPSEIIDGMEQDLELETLGI